ncbi:MAG: Kelch repeat-containing protein, partial [Polyangiales bacterium]
MIAIAAAGCGQRGDAGAPPDAGVIETPATVSRFAEAMAIARRDPTLAYMTSVEAGRFRRENGSWSSRVESEPLRDRFAVTVGERAAAAVDISMGAIRRLQFRRAGANDVGSTLVAGKVFYEDVWNETDVLATASAHRYEELWFLRSAASPNAFAWEVGDRVSTVLEGDGSLSLKDASGATTAKIPAPYAIDARGVKRMATLAHHGGRIEIALDTRGLAFPVLLDPAVETFYWEQADPLPYSLYPSNMAFDEVRGVTVKFGADGTWLFDGAAWTKAKPSTNPPARSDVALAFDKKRSRVVMFGGKGVSTGAARSDTWEWDGTNWSITCVSSPCADAPPAARYGHAMAYSAAHGGVVMFGGNSGSAYLADSLVYDGSVWKVLATSSAPTARENATLAYDANRSVLVLLGGDAGSSTAFADTWELDVTPAWSQKSTASPNGGPFAQPSSYYEPTLKKVVAHVPPDLFNPVKSYSWNGSAWTEITTGGVAATFSSAVWDTKHNFAVVFDGTTKTYVSGTWNTLVARGHAWGWGVASAYDPTAKRVLLVGGCSTSAYAFDCATAKATYYDGKGYYDVADYPSKIAFAAGATDPTKKRALFAGGTNLTLSSGGLSVTVNVNPVPSYEYGASGWSATGLANPTALAG